MEYEVVIGLEVHAQLLTRSKMFCGCNAAYVDAPPNTHVCPICLAMPGSLPVINEKAVEFTVMTGLALNSSIPAYSKFDRKNYPYPDLMKGYQISQYDLPLCVGGWLDIEVEGKPKRAGITRVHLEEDVAKLMHLSDGAVGYTLMDVNRAGCPLMEIVGEPDLRSPEEARQYLTKLRHILQWIGVSTANMDEGAMRCDANVSLRPKGQRELGSKVEVKNMNSIRAVARALEFEIERQTKVLESGGRVVQETRGWVDDQAVTVSQRSKEQAHDYRYFPEPDLPPLEISPAWVNELRTRLPELPDARRERFSAVYGLSRYDAELLTADRATADFYEAALAGATVAADTDRSQAKAKALSNWMQTEVLRLLNARNIELAASLLTPAGVIELLDLVEAGTINLTAAKAVFEEMFDTGKSASRLVEERGLTQINAADELTALVDRVLAAHPQAATDYHAGKQNALGFLVGQIMKETRGRANAGTVNALLRERLDTGGSNA